MENKWLSVAEQLYKVQQQLKKMSEHEKELKEELKKLSDYQDHAEGQFEFNHTVRQGSIAYSRIPFLKEMDLEQFRNPHVDVWKLSVRALFSDELKD